MGERYLQELIIRKEYFNKEECMNVLDSMSNNDYFAMQDVFSKTASESNESEIEKIKVYWLLSDACSMMLSPENKSDPFKPLQVLQGRRSPIVDDFSDEDIVFFSEIIEQIDNMLLKARLADIVWLRSTKNRQNFALIAIESYISTPLDSKMWLMDGSECWDRAFSLALMLREISSAQKMEKEIIRVFNLTKTDDDNNYFALQLIELLRSYRLGIDKAQLIASSLESHAILFDKKNKFTEAIDYFKASSDWYKVAKEEENSIKMIIHVAEMWVKKAIARGVSESNMVAASFYETAIQIYRTIPRKNRSKYGIDDEISKLHRKMNEAGENSLDEMQEFSTKETNITELLNRARSKVSGKSIGDSIVGFANIFQGMQFASLCDEAIKQVNTHQLFSVLCSVTHREKDGRVVHKTPSLDVGADLTYDNDNVKLEVMNYHRIQVTLVVQAYIIPALEVLHREHIIKQSDFQAIVQLSPIIPPGREVFFAKGLFKGYSYDYVTSLHILIPQIENMVRFHLKNAGVKTTTLDAKGIETENGLSTLVVLPEMKDIFGENITFEIEALFCNSLGANLRNNLAHGLLDYDDCNSIYGIYAWWFVLRLIFNAFWNSQRVYSANGQKKDSTPDE